MPVVEVGHVGVPVGHRCVVVLVGVPSRRVQPRMGVAVVSVVVARWA